MNVIRQYFDNLHPDNHLRIRRGFYLEREVESNGTGALTIRWGDQWGLHLLEVILDTGLRVCSYDYYGRVSTTWNTGEIDEHHTQ